MKSLGRLGSGFVNGEATDCSPAGKGHDQVSTVGCFRHRWLYREGPMAGGDGGRAGERQLAMRADEAPVAWALGCVLVLRVPTVWSQDWCRDMDTKTIPMIT